MTTQPRSATVHGSNKILGNSPDGGMLKNGSPTAIMVMNSGHRGKRTFLLRFKG